MNHVREAESDRGPLPGRLWHKRSSGERVLASRPAGRGAALQRERGRVNFSIVRSVAGHSLEAFLEVIDPGASKFSMPALRSSARRSISRVSSELRIVEARAHASPFVKWVGGKTSLLPELIKHVPERVRRYHEPFVGGGALFFATAPRRAVLSDNNPELVHAYRLVRDDVWGVLDQLSRHVYERPHFEAVRALEPSRLGPAERAARFIYLNKTCFNGLWRVNRAGRFNVPIGRYKDPRFCDPETLQRASQALHGVEILHQPFEDALALAGSGDFVYLDPPYDPVSATASFASYTAGGFNWDDQKRLAAGCLSLNRRGVRFLLSNSATTRVRALYKHFQQRIVRAPRHINSKGGGRGHVDEILVFNA
jgi:DNA adenine methylase